MVYASQFGFSVTGDARENSIALQWAVDFDRDVIVDGEGIADVCLPLFVGDGQSITFQKTLKIEMFSRDNEAITIYN